MNGREFLTCMGDSIRTQDGAESPNGPSHVYPQSSFAIWADLESA